METNEKTIVPQHAGTKRKWRIGCVVIITALVVLGVVAGVVFTRQQEQHRQEMLTTLLSKILQGEFAEAEVIYCSLNEKTRQFVQSEVEQSLMREGFNWFVAQSDLISEVKSTTPFDKVHELKSLASAVGVQQLTPLIDKALELEKFVPSASFREVLENDDTVESYKHFEVAVKLYNNGLADTGYIAEALYACADSCMQTVQKVEEMGLEGYRMQELYDFYKQSAESYMIFAQGFKDSDSALLEQGKSAVKEYLQGQILLLEDAKDMTENIRNILEDMLIMIEEY